MSKNILPFTDRNNFKNICFYYFFTFSSREKKSAIGEKIAKFKGVIYIILYNKTNNYYTIIL